MKNDIRLKKIEEIIITKKHDIFILYTDINGIHTDSEGNIYSDEELQAKKKELDSCSDIDWNIVHFVCRQ